MPEDSNVGASGIDRIAAAFAAASEEGRAALMPYLMGGFPDLETSMAVAEAYADTGADLIELGVPYSDPLADGPVIHAAATEALGAGATFGVVMRICERVAARVPVLPMVYANMVLTLGPDRFAASLEASGAVGAIVPDLPGDEDDAVAAALADRGLAMIGFVTPTTSPERLEAIAAGAVGFTYVVSLTGVTGERAEIPPELAELVTAVRNASPAPAAVGFGIGTPEHAAQVGEIADGVIIGSRLVRLVADAGGPDLAADAVGSFMADTRIALEGAAPEGGQPPLSGGAAW